MEKDRFEDIDDGGDVDRTGPDAGGRRSDRRLGPVLALVLVWLVAVAPFVQDLTAQGAPRFAFAAAVVDDGDIRLDDYTLGMDRSERDGHIYSDKAPGQQVFSLPFYAAGRAFGMEPAIVERVEENISLWWVTLWTSILPAAAIVAMIGWGLDRRGTPIPIDALAIFAFGTMLLPFASNLYGHVLAAACAYGAWLLFDGERTSSFGRGLMIGALIGFGTTVEYPVALVALILLGALAVRRHFATLAGAVVGGIPFAAGLLVYQHITFGSAFSSGYSGKDALKDSSPVITGIPNPVTLAQSLFGSRGMALFTPIIIVGFVGLVVRWRRARDEGAMVSLLVCIAFLLLQAGWKNPWGGDGPGPRYVIPMIPFLALGAAEVWRETSPNIRKVVAAVSVTSMVLSTITYHLIPKGEILISAPLQRLSSEGAVPTLWTIALGPAGWVFHVASIVVAATWAYRSVGMGRAAPSA